MAFSGRNAMVSLARRLKGPAFGALRLAQVHRLVGNSRWRTQKLCILCYHGVSMADEHEWLPELFVPPRFLHERLQLLRSLGCNVLPLGEAIDRLYADDLPPRSVAITFDDGFYNYYAAGAPVLDELSVPATNYVSTYYVINQRPMLDLSLRYVLWKRRSETLQTLIDGESVRIDLNNASSRFAAIKMLRPQIARLEDDREEQASWAKRLAESLGFDWDAFVESRLLGLMDASEIRELADRGHDIQLHTHRHRTPRDRELFSREVTENRHLIEQMTGRSAVHFCYPSGDYDQMFIPWLESSGVESATIGTSALCKSGHSPFLLPRYIDTIAQSAATFENWVLGLDDWVRAATR